MEFATISMGDKVELELKIFPNEDLHDMVEEQKDISAHAEEIK